ncbi:jg27990, partial [Pararge aegeria aegeria]
AETRFDIRTFENDNTDAMKAVESASQMSPNLKRYWRRRAEELKEEQFYQLVSEQFGSRNDIGLF